MNTKNASAVNISVLTAICTCELEESFYDWRNSHKDKTIIDIKYHTQTIATYETIYSMLIIFE